MPIHITMQSIHLTSSLFFQRTLFILCYIHGYQFYILCACKDFQEFTTDFALMLKVFF